MPPKTRSNTQQQEPYTPYYSTRRNSSRDRNAGPSTQAESRTTGNAVKKTQSKAKQQPGKHHSKTIHSRANLKKKASFIKEQLDDSTNTDDKEPVTKEVHKGPSLPDFDDKDIVTSEYFGFYIEGEGKFYIKPPASPSSETTLAPGISGHCDHTNPSTQNDIKGDDIHDPALYILKRFKSDLGCVCSNMEETISAIEFMNRGNKRRTEELEGTDLFNSKRRREMRDNSNNNGQQEDNQQLYIKNIRDKMNEGRELLNALDQEYKKLEKSYENITHHIHENNNIGRNAEAVTLSYRAQDIVHKKIPNLLDLSIELNTVIERVHNIFLDE